MSTKHIFSTIAAIQAKEREKSLRSGIGRLRGGNCGLYEEGEKPALQCPRKTILRTFFGIEEDVTESKRFIFDAGLDSEAKLVADLTLYAHSNRLTLLTQQQAGTTLKLPSGTLVTGSPDAVFVDANGKPVHGFEAKQMVSAYKCKDILTEHAGADAVAQAALYSYCHGKLPWTLVYTSAVQHHSFKAVFGSDAVINNPRFAHLIDWNTKGECKSLLGFRVAYDLVWGAEDRIGLRFAGMWPDGDNLLNRPREEILWTEITMSRILGYYNLCDDPTGKSWPDAPAMIDLAGKEKGFKLCDYCSLKPVCKKLGKQSSVAKMADYILTERRKGNAV